MRVSSYVKLAKYWAKGRVLSVSPAAYWQIRRSIRGIWEKEILLLPTLCRPGSVALDVGAHFGMYTHEMVKCGVQVECFEPIPALAAILRSGYRRLPAVTVHEVALSEFSGAVDLRCPRAGLGRSTIEMSNRLLGRKDPTAPIDIVRVQMRPLDDYSFCNVSFCKIDVEGHELAVLKGGLGMLSRQLPALQVEIEERHKSQANSEVAELLVPLGYREFQFDGVCITSRRVKDSNNYLFLTDAHLAQLDRAGFPTASARSNP